MINTNMNDYDGVLRLGNVIKQEVRKLYKHLEIEIDAVFKTLLLFCKKKYAALVINEGFLTKEIKGLDIVRRDWCPLAKHIGEQILDELLYCESYDLAISNITNILRDTAANVENYDLKLFEISKVIMNFLI